jgi:DNA-binding PadR family transcriptional regulator
MQNYVMHRGRGRGHLGLRTYVMFSLLESPKNGIEIAYDLVRLLGWRPSPGSLYPLLMDLEREGLIERTEDGKLRLTPHGIDYMSSIPFAINVKSILFMMEVLVDRLAKRIESEGLNEEEKKKLSEIAQKILSMINRS